MAGKITLHWRDDLKTALETDFTGELLHEVIRERKFCRAPYVKGDTPIYLRRWTWTAYKTESGHIILHSYWREIMTDRWDGAVAFYKDVQELCSHIHMLVGRDGSALAELRRKLLASSLTANIPMGD